jgi:hypothetical protein
MAIAGPQNMPSPVGQHAKQTLQSKTNSRKLKHDNTFSRSRLKKLSHASETFQYKWRTI